ncbi:hypothetical protein [Novipirellula caenicola]|uniref:hypothetical protein n=1 Tax=Novipirellula caenicola TaxID=1536901 RepID=UPI0031EBB2C9
MEVPEADGVRDQHDTSTRGYEKNDRRDGRNQQCLDASPFPWRSRGSQKYGRKQESNARYLKR